MYTRVLAMGLTLIGMSAMALFVTSTPSSAAAPTDSESVVQMGFAIAPVPLNLTRKNRALVGKGSYLVNAAGGCNDCHTWRPDSNNPNGGSNYEPGGDPFLGQPEQIYTEGYLGGGRPFGPFTSRNLTPDFAGVVAGGYGEFRDIIRHGTDPDLAHPAFGPLLQVMPWPVYRNMTENDIKAIYEYLTAIPCVPGTPGEPTNDLARCH